MSKILAITGATGKRSGGYFTKVLCEHADEVNAMFDGGIRTIVRETANTAAQALSSAASRGLIQIMLAMRLWPLLALNRMSIRLICM